MRRLLALAVVSVLALAGCGNKHPYNQFAETEGVYVDVGNLVYQVQMSRFLTPGDPEDREYLQGLGATAAPTADETWFGVWMRVKNYSNESLERATDIFVVDSDDKRFAPIALDNPFAYQGGINGADAVYPTPDTAAASGPIQGSLILYKLTNNALQNRPLRLEIEQEGAESAEIELDL
jgi:hypothetical protein